MEPLFNFHWAFMALGVLRLYHYLVLQPLSFLTEVNLNSMLCPAISDPFAGPWYRLAANIHQTFFFILHGKIYCFLGNKFFAPSATSAALAAEYYNIMSKVSETYRNGSKNGHSKFKIVSYDEREEDDAAAASSSSSLDAADVASSSSTCANGAVTEQSFDSKTETETIRAQNGSKDDAYSCSYVNVKSNGKCSILKED